MGFYFFATRTVYALVERRHSACIVFYMHSINFRNPGEAINEDARKKKLHLFKFDLTKPVSQCRNNNKKVVNDDFLYSTSIDDESVGSAASADSNKSVDSASSH